MRQSREIKVQPLDEVTMLEFEEMTKRTDVAIVPVGVIEAHGAHGPLGFDNFIAEEIASRLAKRASAILLPVISYGCCKVGYDATNYPGTISISPEIMSNLYYEVGKELARQGVKRMVFVNAHFGNSPSLQIAAYKIWGETGCAVGILETWVAAKEETLKIAKSVPHADESETSMLLLTKGARFIKMERAKGAKPKWTEHELVVRKAGMIDKYTRFQPHPSYGEPKQASREQGEKIVSATIKKGIALIEVLKAHVKS